METKTHICPVWVGYIMSSPLRKLQQNPIKILAPYISEGMRILEIGPAMGFFSIPMARMTGISGKVYSIDIQEPMLSKLNRRARKAGVDEIIETRLCTTDIYPVDDLIGTIDFTLLAYVVHEVPDQNKLFALIAKVMKRNSIVLLLEPKSHVSPIRWEKSLAAAVEHGFQIKHQESRARTRAVSLHKP
jgi:ubiquinone/menaquinone biosynthesis C-methylase UbiE